MELRWTEEGRDCTASFRLEAEARQFAALLGSRQGVQDVQLLDADGVALKNS
jgi:hypothetical protein